MKKIKFEIIPDGCWGYNLRSVLPAKLWNFIKNDVKTRADGKCEICGKPTKKLDAHESWEFSKDGIAKLVDVVAICKDCHDSIHIERTHLMCTPERIERVENHYINVNDCTYAEFRLELGKANLKHRELNAVSEWRLDLSYLKKYTK